MYLSGQHSHWPGCVTSGCGWPVPAFSVAFQHPWLCAAPFVTFGCSPQRLSGWCLYSNASLCRRWSDTRRIKTNQHFQISVIFLIVDKKMMQWKHTGHLTLVSKYPALWYGHWCWIFASSQLKLAEMTRQRKGAWREGHIKSRLQTRTITSWILHDTNKMLNKYHRIKNMDLLRLWLSFFCLSFIIALASASAGGISKLYQKWYQILKKKKQESQNYTWFTVGTCNFPFNLWKISRTGVADGESRCSHSWAVVEFQMISWELQQQQTCHNASNAIQFF